LDAQTRIQMRELLLRIWAKNRKAVVFVTHDIDEAILLADRILVLSQRPGRIKAEFNVNLPRPRKYEIFLQQEFLELKKKLMKSI
jgi:ABC-type nitrate/sulfonate/bicarbonate transport system ATPase subunit